FRFTSGLLRVYFGFTSGLLAVYFGSYFGFLRDIFAALLHPRQSEFISIYSMLYSGLSYSFSLPLFGVCSDKTPFFPANIEQRPKNVRTNQSKKAYGKP